MSITTFEQLVGIIPRTDGLPIVDLGSGVTFFPFAVARMGHKVVCVDMDPVCERDITRACAIIDQRPGSVSFRMTDGTRLPLTDDEAGAVYSISVLEHVRETGRMIEEVARILRPGGRFILTIDLDLRGDQEIGIGRYRSLMEVLARHFTVVAPDQTIHPADMLRSDKGDYPARPVRSARGIFWAVYSSLRHGDVAGLLSIFRIPFLLAVEGMVFAKR